MGATPGGCRNGNQITRLLLFLIVPSYRSCCLKNELKILACARIKSTPPEPRYQRPDTTNGLDGLLAAS